MFIDIGPYLNCVIVVCYRDEVLHWTRSVAYEIGFVILIMRSDTNTGVLKEEPHFC